MRMEKLTELFDKDGNLLGVVLSAEAWDAVRGQVEKALDLGAAPRENPEPLADWETLKQYWDFGYPVDTDVACSACGAQSADWAADEPRKFRLLAATLGGLVTFRCQCCQAKILKKHFKKHITTEVFPFQAAKDSAKEAHYPDHCRG